MSNGIKHNFVVNAEIVMDDDVPRADDALPFDVHPGLDRVEDDALHPRRHALCGVAEAGADLVELAQFLDEQGETDGTVRDVQVDLDTWKVTSLMADLGGIFTQDVETIGVGPVVGVDRENGIVNVSTAPEKLGHGSTGENLPFVFPYVPPIA